jgi:hypothetical protein
MHRRRAKCYIPDLLALDIHKERNSIAVAESGRSRPVEYLGEIANEPGAIGKLCDRLGRAAGKRLAFCYEAGPCGYGVHRQLTRLGHRCDVVAPSLIPKKPGSGEDQSSRRHHARPSSSCRRTDAHLEAPVLRKQPRAAPMRASQSPCNKVERRAWRELRACGTSRAPASIAFSRGSSVSASSASQLGSCRPPMPC